GARERRDRRDHELRRQLRLDQFGQRPQQHGARPPRVDGRPDRRGPLERVHRPQPPAHGPSRRDGGVLRLRHQRLRRHQAARPRRDGHHRGQRPGRAPGDFPLPCQRDLLLADGRHAGLLGSGQQLPHQGHAHRDHGLGAQRRRRERAGELVQRRRGRLGGGAARISRPRPRRLRHLQQQQHGAGRQRREVDGHARDRDRDGLAGDRGQARPFGVDGDGDLDLRPDGNGLRGQHPGRRPAAPQREHHGRLRHQGAHRRGRRRRYGAAADQDAGELRVHAEARDALRPAAALSAGRLGASRPRFLERWKPAARRGGAQESESFRAGFPIHRHCSLQPMTYWKGGSSMRLSTPTVLCGCLLVLGVGCAKSDGGGDGQGGDGGSATGGSSGTGTGGSGSGTGGSTTTGGSTGNGGSSVATGGKTGTGGAKGGSTGSGGSTSTGGSTGTGGAPGTGGSASASCTITPTAMASTKIGTVGIVTFTTSLPSPTAAQIDFGPDTNYGLTAPVDLTQTNYRTLLLAMKPSKAYHYRISVTNASGTCAGGDNTIMTGPQPNGTLPTLTVTPTAASASLYKGFIVTGAYQASGGAPAYILDSDGSFVWWYDNGISDACGARMSYDAQYMWVASANVPDTSATDHVYRVSMDGLNYTDFTPAFAHHSHQVTPMPDGSVAFYTTGSNGCDDVKILPPNATPTSTATTLVNARTAHGGMGACHLNNIEYSPTDDALIFSDLDNSCLTKVDRKTGSTIWVLNGGSSANVMSTFTGDSYVGGEHGFQIISVMNGVNDILMFNNNTGHGSSQALEFTLDQGTKTSKKIFTYTPSPAINVMVLGDVQRLPNGNTIVDFGTGDQIQEVTSSGTVVQTIKSQVAFGFFEKRASLYGPSTK